MSGDDTAIPGATEALAEIWSIRAAAQAVLAAEDAAEGERLTETAATEMVRLLLRVIRSLQNPGYAARPIIRIEPLAAWRGEGPSVHRPEQWLEAARRAALRFMEKGWRVDVVPMTGTQEIVALDLHIGEVQLPEVRR